MTQSNAIAGAIALSFAVFVIVRGELPCYMQILGVATDAACPKGSSPTPAANAPNPTAPVAIAYTTSTSFNLPGSSGGGGSPITIGVGGNPGGSVGCFLGGC